MKKVLIPRWSCAVVVALLTWVAIRYPQTAASHEAHTGSALASPVSCECTNIPFLPPVMNLTPFLDPLPVPPKAIPARTNFNYCVPVATNLCFPNGIPEYDMPMTNFPHYFHTNLPPVEVWGYAGSYPGPTFDVAVNAPILVNWMNRLPTNYPCWLPANTNLGGVPDNSVRTVVHLHGGATLPRYDGYPTNWFRSGQSDQYFYGNIQLDTNGHGQTLWYHDHAVGVTANNVYAGLAGLYLLRQPAFETNLNLPSGDYEIPLVFQDRDIQTNCAPASLLLTQFPFTSLAVVNGKVTPYLAVEPRRYRFRILNGATYRTFGLALSVTDANGVPLTNAPPAPPFNVIGTEDGFLQRTVQVPATNGIPIMPAERVDVIIDFTRYTNSIITVTNQLRNGDVPFPPHIGNIMQFRVSLAVSSPDTSSIPGLIVTNWQSTSNLVSQAVTNRQITLDINSAFFESPFPGGPYFTTNAYFGTGSGGPFALLNLKPFEDGITETPHAGDTEIWEMVNLSNVAHPIHLHLIDFRVIDRRRFGGWFTNDLTITPTMVTNYINDRASNALNNLSYYLTTGTNDIDFQTAKPFESGPKDTVRAAPFAVTRIVVQWPTNLLYYTTPSAMSLEPDTSGRYVYHCHLLDHEDDDMMRPFQLMSPHQPTLQTLLDPTVNVSGFNHFKLGIRTRPNETYRIESSTDLSPSSWLELPLADVVGSGGLIHIVPPPATDNVRFYRIKRLRPP